jgi:hypothetical protein
VTELDTHVITKYRFEIWQSPEFTHLLEELATESPVIGEVCAAEPGLSLHGHCAWRTIRSK